MFKGVLNSKIHDTSTSLCIGIDPHFHGLPSFMKEMIEEKGSVYFLEWFGECMLNAAKKEAIPAIKLQSAFFEAYGKEGHVVMENLIRKARNFGVLSILDAKRGDISSTMEAYGKASFDLMDADILTVTPYMGYDVIKPLVPWLKNGKGIYVVWMSSNPSGKDIQELEGKDGKIASETLFDLIESNAEKDGVLDGIGYVLGATKVNGLSENLYRKVKTRPMLMPGVGAQGADAKDPKLSAMLENKVHLVPISRGVSGYGQGYLDEELLNSSENDYQEFVNSRVRELKLTI